MRESSYVDRRNQLTTYFDHTAAGAWKALTSTDPVSRIRATVRAGRDNMRATLLSWLPADLTGRVVYDAGCGTGSFSIDAARRGAHVIAIDVASNLVEVARQRAAEESLPGSIDFRVGDMLGDAPKDADYVVAMDSLIHYDEQHVRRMVGTLAATTKRAVLFTSAPRTVALSIMHFAGRFVPQRSDRSPAIEPINIAHLMRGLDHELGAEGWMSARTERVKSGFYISQAVELKR